MLKIKKTTHIRLSVLICALLLLPMLILLDGCDAAGEPPAQDPRSHAHEFGEWVYISASTCVRHGSRERTCVCGAVQNEYLPLAEHTLTVIEAVAPTCTNEGRTAGVCCSVCESVITPGETIPPTGHTPTSSPEIAPSCSEYGYTGGEQCSVCGEVITEPSTIARLPHTPVVTEGKAPTCSEAGYTQSEVCSVCGEILTEAMPIECIGHTPAERGARAATCTEAGCTAQIYCSVCGEILTESTETAPLGHKSMVVSGTPATCTESGCTDSKKCSRCGQILQKSESIAPLGHDPVTFAATAPTCTEEGVSEHLGCSRCKIALSEYTTTAPTGHSPVTVAGAEPTCTRRGYSESVECGVCHAVLEAPSYSDPLGHKFSENKCTVCSALAASALGLSTEYYGLYELDTLKMICENNVEVPRSPASITKLMCAATALKYLPEDTVLTTGYELYLVNLELSRAYLGIGVQLTLRDMLVAMLLPSGSDAAYTIAVHVAWHVSGNDDMSYEDALDYFVGLMNDYAKEIGVTSTHFKNPVGESTEGHYTTIADLALIASHISKAHPTIVEISSMYKCTVTFLDGTKETWYTTNMLLIPNSSYYHPGARGLKTGTTNSAGYCVCAIFEIDGKEYLAIVMGCESNAERYKCTRKLVSLVE